MKNNIQKGLLITLLCLHSVLSSYGQVKEIWTKEMHHLFN